MASIGQGDLAFEFAPGKVHRPRKIAPIADGFTYRTGGEDTGRIVTTPDDLLVRFIALEQAPDVAIRRFADQYAPLGICPGHGAPINHGAWLTIEHLAHAGVPRFTGPCWELDDEGSPIRRETFADWRLWCVRFGLLRERIAHLKAGRTKEQPPPLNRHFMLGVTRARELSTTPTSRRLKRSSNSGWAEVETIINRWLRYANVAPILVCRSTRGVDIGGDPRYLFPALTLAILFNATGMAGSPRCYGCGAALAPTDDGSGRHRAPKRNQKNWCKPLKPECAKLRKQLSRQTKGSTNVQA